MGPAILLCPSSTAVQLLGQVSPSKNARQREGIVFVRHFANVHWTRSFPKRPAFLFHSPAPAGKCRENNCPFAWRTVFAAAAGGDLSVEAAAVSSDAVLAVEPPAPEETPSAEPKPQARRNLTRSNSSNSRAAVVSPAELVTGATFPGKVITIQPFGAFVDLGAFTNGLVHISRLSKAYVKKVEDVVQIGQDVNVQVLDVDLKANRISLMLVEEEKEEAEQEGEGGEKQTQGPSSQEQGRRPRREPSRRPGQSNAATETKMKKGEIVTGTVKNMIRSGVFVTLPDGTDGYLPTGEVVFRAPITKLESLFQVGQQVTVRVLRIERGRVTLSTKQEVDYDKINEALNKDVVGGATSPFEIAFRRNELIANFLDEREKLKTEAEAEKSAAKGEKEEAPLAEGPATEPVSAAASEELTEQDEGAESVAEVNLAEEVSAKGATSDEEAPLSELSDAKKLVEEGVDAIKEAVAAVEEAIAEQAGAAVEEVVTLAEEECTKGEAAVVEETVEEVVAVDEEAPPSELSDAKKLVEEGVGTIKEAVAAVEEAIAEQAGTAAEEVETLAEEESTKGEAAVVEETVKEVVAVVEEEEEAVVVVGGGGEEAAAPVEASVEEEVKGAGGEDSEATAAARKEEDGKEVTKDNTVLLHAAEVVVGANAHQS